MKLPSSVKIGPFIYDVSKKKNPRLGDKPVAGYIQKDTHKIVIKEGFSSSLDMEVLLHECLHGIVELSGTSGPITWKNEEPIVSFLSLHLTALLLDNPKLTEMFLNESKRRRQNLK